MALDGILFLSSLITSIISGVLGFGGGLLLLPILSLYLPPSIIIPIHGLTQLTSNSSRVIFSFKNVHWKLLPRFLIGSLIGVFVFGFLIASIPVTYIPLAIGSYILLNMWSIRFSTLLRRYENYYLIGFVQTGLGLLVGATGPLSLSILTKELDNKDEVIATSAIFMSISHLVKVPVFMLLGFSLIAHIHIILYMVLGSIIGSFIGVRLRKKTNNDSWFSIIKILLTLLALKMIIGVFFGY